jgi:hypothetical protein
MCGNSQHEGAHGVAIAEDLLVGHTHYGHAEALQSAIASQIIFDAVLVNGPIHLHGKSQLRAVEVDDVTRDWMLASETKAPAATLPKYGPHCLLGVGWLTPQSTSERSLAPSSAQMDRALAGISSSPHL